MSLRINTNVEAAQAHRQLSQTSSTLTKSMERLSSGLRINRAADDAAGLGISEKMRSQVKGLAQAQRNIQDGVSMLQTAEGNLDEVHSMLQRVRELAVQYKNGTLSQSSRDAIQTEVNQLASEIERIGATAEFNGLKLLNAAGSVTFQVGANDGQTISAATFGALQNRLEHSLAQAAVYQENLIAAESRIRDVDMAEEMVNLTKNQVLQQAGTAMLAQANQSPQAVLSLLR
jgi:flagellin